MRFSLLLCSLLISNFSFAKLVAPDHWWQESSEQITDSKQNALNLVKISNVLNHVFDTQNTVLEERKQASHKFKLSEYASGFSVSKSGLFGLSALNAKQSIEVYWKNKKTKELKLKEKSLSFKFSKDPKIKNMQFSQISDLVALAGPLFDLVGFRKNLNEYFKDMNLIFTEISESHWQNWHFDGLRSDLYISVDGSISYVASVGAAIRLRVEWDWTPSEAQEPKSNLSKLIKNLLGDLDNVLANYSHQSFDLDKAYVGIGYSAGLRLFGLASSKYSLMAYARFIKKNNAAFLNPQDISNDEYSLLTGEENQKGVMDFFRIRRRKWRSGLLKALHMSSPFLTSAATEYQSWEIYKVRTRFQLSYRGWLGFSSRSTNAALELVFKKQNHMIESSYVLAPIENTVDSNWTLRTLRIRGRLNMEISIPFLANAKVYPELELYWAR